FLLVKDRFGPSLPPPQAPRADLTVNEQATIGLFQRASPSVVFITGISLQREYFSLNVLKVPEGTGSGFIWDEDGHIVTNWHVIQNAQEIHVTLIDQSTYQATVRGKAPDKDLAVLKIDAPASILRPIAVGRSSDLQVGQTVFAIGNPFGLDHTLTSGLIGRLGGEIESVNQRPIQGVIQTDAAINPGNSGGPLLDSAGELIGVNTSIYSPSGANAGIGFAVPVDTVSRIVPQIIEHGKVIRPGLGIQMAEGGLQLNGVLVLTVLEGGGAAEAGIRPTLRDRRGRIRLGDVIVGVNGEEVRDPNGLFRILDRHKVGDEVEVTLNRDNQLIKKSVTLMGLE
ncbi:MAG: trypsin-like peptidase domain-containing protein, partial [Verrucomicrobiota bacterium]